MAKQSAETATLVAFSEALLRALEDQRNAGGDAYPPTLRHLAERCEGSPTIEQTIKAVGKKPFSERAVVLEKDGRRPKVDSPVCFKEDRREIQDRKLIELSTRLVHLLESQRQIGGDAYPPSLQRLIELCDGLASADQIIRATGKKPFSQRAVIREKENRRPKLDSPVCLKDDKPSKEKLEAELAELADRLLRVLESQRRLGGDAYPPTLARLVELCGLKASQVAGIVGHARLAGRVLVAAKRGKNPAPDAPVVLMDDLSSALPMLAEYALGVAARGQCAFSAKELSGKLVVPLKEPLQHALGKGQIEHQALPSGIVWVPGKGGEPLLFDLADLRPVERRPSSEGPQAVAPSTPRFPESDRPLHSGRREFAEAFHEAFERIDRRNGTTNFVKLSDLRRALSEFGREEFDAGLRKLREGGQFALDRHEGLRGTLTPEDREAGVQEVGSLFIYASRR